MPSYPLTALVLRKTKLGETDIILTLLAHDGRQVRAVAKGLRKPGSRFGGRLEPFSVVDLLCTPAVARGHQRGPDGHAHAALREDLDRSAAASVVADLLDKIAVEGQAEPRLYALATTTWMDGRRSGERAARSSWSRSWSRPWRCTATVPSSRAALRARANAASSHTFSLSAGGSLCDSCGDLDASSLRFPVQAREWLQHCSPRRWPKSRDLDMPPAAVSDCFMLVRSFVAYHFPARLKALDFYAGLM